MNLASVVRDNARDNPTRPAILFREHCLSYAELWASVEGVAAALAGIGVQRGDRVGLSMKEHPGHLIAHFAVARLGAVIVPMDHRWTPGEKLAAADAFRTAVVLIDEGELPGVVTMVLDDTARSSDAGTLPACADEEGDLLISLSSGTTGKPKGAVVTHRNLYERFVSQWRAIGYGADDCFAILTPFYFGAGRSFGMSLLAAGGTVRIAPPPMKPPEVLQVLSDPAITATFLPPTMLRRLFEFHEPGNPPLLQHLRFLIASGEPLFADEARRCREALCPNLFSYYASSEGGGISVLRPEDFEEHAATVGQATYKTDVQIVDENDRMLPPGKVGRLRYRGPGVATRYLDSDGQEHEAAVGGWFYPGDLAEVLDSGFIALRGRDKDVIIRGGVNIYPAEIEAVLLQHPAITEAAVVGIGDASRGQRVVAFLASADSTVAAGLPEWCRERLAPYKIPEDLRVLRELPRRASGKVDKQALLGRPP